MKKKGSRASNDPIKLAADRTPWRVFMYAENVKLKKKNHVSTWFYLSFHPSRLYFKKTLVSKVLKVKYPTN